jgi:Tol biopolymer transport system component
MKLRIVLAGLTFGLVALAAETGAELFQKALAAERAAGNLEEAIKLYQRIAKEFASDRALAAKALVQEGRCYEKLGKDNAVRIYEQVARDYKDQPAPSAAASARLAALKLGERSAGPGGMTQRKIDVPFSTDSAAGLLATDGRRQVYLDAAAGALMIGDLPSKDKRLVFKPKVGDRILAYLASRDLSTVLFYLQRGDGSRQWASVRSDGAGYREYEQHLDSDSSSIPDWSWDNRHAFFCVTDSDGSRQLWRQSMTDGEIRKVPMACGDLNRPSPDGRFIGLSTSFRKKDFDKIFVAPIEGGEPQLVSDNARLIDWTRDGRYLIIASARFGGEAMYLLPVREGRRSGDPILVRYGPCEFGSVNTEGSLICSSTFPGGYYGAWLGTMDPSGRTAEWRELNLRAGGQFSEFSAWSPDSSQFIYHSQVGAGGPNDWVVRRRDLASGEEREVYRGHHRECAWPENSRLICTNSTSLPPIEVFSISLDSGGVESLGEIPGSDGYPFFGGPDGKEIFIARQPREELIRWDIATRQATVVDRLPGLYAPGDSFPRPSEHWVARRNQDKIETRPMAGGEWRALISLPTTHMVFTPDGNWLLFHDVDAAGKHGLFRVSTAGGQRERIGDFPSVGREQGDFHVSPDGRKLLVKSRTDQQVWILENFEPKQTAAR